MGSLGPRGVSGQLFALPPIVAQEPLEPDPPPLENATAEDIKAALRRRHPGDTHGSMPGQWTCIEEWLNIDLLALNAWQKADVIGYEVKVSRSDLRRELLRPHKRADALARTTEFYLAVPAGLLSAAEIAYDEPEWEPEDFARVECDGVPEFGPSRPRYNNERKRYGGRCAQYSRSHHGHKRTVPAPLADVIVLPDWMKPREGESEDVFLTRAVADHRSDYNATYAVCWACNGRGYLEKSRVEREAPTCWVPRDLGLIAVNARGCRVVKASPKRKEVKPIAGTRKQLNDLVRWVSHRPDPRHR